MTAQGNEWGAVLDVGACALPVLIGLVSECLHDFQQDKAYILGGFADFRH